MHKKDLHIKVSTGAFTCILIKILFCLYNVIMYAIIGKQNCIQCDALKNLLDKKGMQYKYLDMTDIPNKTMTYVRMYCNSFPIVLNITHSFSNLKRL